VSLAKADTGFAIGSIVRLQVLRVRMLARIVGLNAAASQI
jgi:hypothetical protein